MSLLSTIARRAFEGAAARAPTGMQEAVARVRQRYEAGVVDAQRALEELSQLEERVAKATIAVVAFPFVAFGAIRELYGRVGDLERSLEERDATIRKLEARLRELEQRR